MQTEIAVLIFSGIVDYSIRYNIPPSLEQIHDMTEIISKLSVKPEMLSNADLMEIGLKYLKENL